MSSGRPGRLTSRGPIERRLWRHVPAVRLWTAVSVAVGVAMTGCLVAQATFLARALAAGVDHRMAVMGGALIGLVVASTARACVAFVGELSAAGAAARAKAQLRAAGVARLLAGAPASLAERRLGELAVSLGHGLDALDVYIGRYLPRLVLAVLAPLVLVVWIAHLDWLSAAILVVTLVLLPVFMVLVGQLTQQRVAQRWAALGSLSAHFLDAVEGLATLRAFGRAGIQRRTIEQATDRLRRATLGTLRVAFLSALVLETLAAVGTALVAVPLGLRLVDGRMALAPALAILILTPEVYLPLRRASAEFHASTDATTAADAVVALLEEEEGTLSRPPATASYRCALTPVRPAVLPVLALSDVSVSYPGRAQPAVAGVTLTVGAGEHVGVVGPSGAGKSTVAAVAAGLLGPTSGCVQTAGRVYTGDRVLDEPAAWRAQVAWVPQRPTIFSGSVADNLHLSVPGASDDQLWAALRLAGLAEVVAALPRGLEAPLTERGATLSAGERQRLGLARALLRTDAALVVLDEPTAHLDAGTEAQVVGNLRQALAGRAVLLVTHRRKPLELADRVVRLEGGRLRVAEPDLCPSPDLRSAGPGSDEVVAVAAR